MLFTSGGVSAVQIAFALCAMGAIGGLSLALLGAGGLRLPAFMGMVHGLSGLAGIALLFVLNLRGEEATPAAAWQALILLVLAMLGGLVVLRTLYHGRPPLVLALSHGAIAALGLWLLWPVAVP